LATASADVSPLSSAPSAEAAIDVDLREDIAHGLRTRDVSLQPGLDLVRELAGALRGHELQRVQPVQRRDRGDAEGPGEQHDVLEVRLGFDERTHARARGQQLGGEGVGLDLPRVTRAGREGRGGVDRRAVMAAAGMSELVGDREALALDGLRAVDPDDRADAVAPQGAGDVVGERADDHRQARVVLDQREHAADGRDLVEAQALPCLARALRAAIGVQARHPGTGSAFWRVGSSVRSSPGRATRIA
jgi:hypothetical protein